MDKATLEALLGVEFTDEQYAEYSKQHESELDKARTQASQTAAKNAAKKTKSELEAEIELKAKEKAQDLLKMLTQSEEDKLEDARKALEADRAALEQEKKSTAVSAKLKAAGYKDNELSALTDLFSIKESIDDCEVAVDSFLESVNKTITAKVDEFKAALTKGGASPAVGAGSAQSTVLDEEKILSEVYSHVKDDGFANNRGSNMALDAYAIMMLENAQQTMGSTK
jgi:hypothetical protein